VGNFTLEIPCPLTVLRCKKSTTKDLDGDGISGFGGACDNMNRRGGEVDNNEVSIE
jgi:hypothetical protein